jgi:ribosome modulation factor
MKGLKQRCNSEWRRGAKGGLQEAILSKRQAGQQQTSRLSGLSTLRTKDMCPLIRADSRTIWLLLGE